MKRASCSSRGERLARAALGRRHQQRERAAVAQAHAHPGGGGERVAGGLDLVVELDGGALLELVQAAVGEPGLVVRDRHSRRAGPAPAAIFAASATLNGRHICAACRSTGCGLVRRPWMMRGMPSCMVAMSSPAKPCSLAQRQHAVDAGRDPRGGGVGFHQHVHEMEALAEPALDDRRIPAVAIGAGEAAGCLRGCRPARRSPAGSAAPPRRRTAPRARPGCACRTSPNSRTARPRWDSCRRARSPPGCAARHPARGTAAGRRPPRCRTRRRCRCSGSRA